MGYDWLQPDPILVSVQIGSETYGNSFTSFKWADDYGGGVLIQPGVTNSSIRHSAFDDGQFGVLIDQRNDGRANVNSFKINGNTFSKLSVSGVFIWDQTPVVEELNDNIFTNISTVNGVNPFASGAWALAANGGVNDARFPLIRKARRNRFVGNDIGVVFGDAKGIDFATNSPVDFGRADDPGGNVFHCNSQLNAVAGDVLISVSGTGAIPFAGNVWDHAPPTTASDVAAANGTDVIFYASSMLDMSNASVDVSACPAGHVLGP